MSQRFLNGTVVAKARMAISLIAEIQATNTEAMLELYPDYSKSLGEGVRALQEIADKLRVQDHEDRP